MQTQETWTQEKPETPDSALVQQALAGHQEAFEALVSRYEQSLLGLIYSYVGQYHEAQNVLQHVWLQLYLSLATLRQNGRIKPQRAILALPHSYRSVVLLSYGEQLTFTPDWTSPQNASLDSQNPIPSSPNHSYAQP